MKKILFTICYNEISLPYFLTSEAISQVEPTFLNYSEENSYFEQVLSGDFDYIFIRDPFLDGLSNEVIDQKIKLILKHKKKAYIVDKIDNLEDVYFEDKWNQYQLFSNLMPQTSLLESKESFDPGTSFLKKRISSRAKGVIFNQKDITAEPNEYIIQPKLNIEKEFRVFIIFDEILETAEIKSSKSEQVQVKVVGIEKINDKVKEIAQAVRNNTKFDFLGLDIAQLDNGEYKLIEVNRSCQFGGFQRETGNNLGEYFIKKLIQKF